MPITVNDDVISDEVIHRETQYHPAESLGAAQNKAAETLVIRSLLLQEAKREGLLTGEGEEAESDALSKLVDMKVNVPPSDTETCERYYQQNRQRFQIKETPGEYLPIEQAIPKIREYLVARSTQEGIRAYIQVLASEANIKGFAFTSGA